MIRAVIILACILLISTSVRSQITWEPLGPPGPRVSDVNDLHGDSGTSRLFAATRGGLFRLDESDDWTHLTLGIPENFQNESWHAVLVSSSGAVIASCFNGIFASVDGESFIKLPNGLPDDTSAHRLVEANGIIYAATGSGVYMLTGSILNGTWTAINDGLPRNYTTGNQEFVSRLVVSPSGDLFARSFGGTASIKPPYSSVWNPIIYEHPRFDDIAFGSGVIFAGSYGISRGEYDPDYTYKWTSLNSNLPTDYSYQSPGITAIHANGPFMIAALYQSHHGMHYSLDGGVSWTSLLVPGDDQWNRYYAQLEVRRFFARNRKSELYAATEGGVIKATGLPVLTHHFITQPVSQIVRPGESITLSATLGGSTPTSISWSHNGEIIPGANQLSLTVNARNSDAAGEYTLTATNDSGIIQTTARVEVQKIAQSITFDSISDRRLNDKPFSLSATASSKLPIFFDVVNGPAWVDNENKTLHFTGESGTFTIRATQGGNTVYLAAEPKEQSFKVYSKLFKNNNLAYLTLSKGRLNPAFTSSTTLYTSKVKSSAKSIKLIFTPKSPQSTIKVNGTSFVGGAASNSIPLRYGKNRISINVIAESGDIKTYRVIVTRSKAD
jgi:hypothetical protein